LLRLDLAICIGLLLSILAVYVQVGTFDFVNYDDPGYVTENPHLQGGLTPGNIRWAFSAVVVGNWMPVTVLSHMLDFQLFGMRSGLHHLENLLLHAFSTLLLFAVFNRATRSPRLSAFVAAVFAFHPLHVQSVAWVAERKDVLSAFFFIAALYCYTAYVENPGIGRYLMLTALFCLGLMSKPMLVTLPFVLLLWDFWPLGRTRWNRMLLEKLPLFALSAAVSVVTYRVQHAAGAVQSTALSVRIENALISYLIYIGQTLWPSHLAPFYPYPSSIPLWEPTVAALVLLGISALVLLNCRTRPYLPMGWFWYLGTLIPVIGLVKVGEQAHADRYMYLPMIGLTIMAGCGAIDLARKRSWAQPMPAALAIAGCAAVCMTISWRQTTYWENSETLFQHATDVTDNNWMAEGMLGQYLMTQPGRRSDAVDHLDAALRIAPNFAEAHNNLGLCLFQAGLYHEAMPHFEESVRLKPGAPQPLSNLGLCLMNIGSYEVALPYFAAALRARPDSPDIHLDLAMTLSKIPGREQEAIDQYLSTLRLRPNYAEAHFALGLFLASLGRKQEAISHLEAGLLVHPEPAISRALEQLRTD
jgi:tetratricopeptide (TPR) repeat protein